MTETPTVRPACVITQAGH